MERIRKLADANNINLISQPVNSTADVQLVTASLLSKNIDVFFANPDNVVFGSFETIIQSCNQKTYLFLPVRRVWLQEARWLLTALIFINGDTRRARKPLDI